MYKYVKSLRNYIPYLTDNAYVRNKIYRECYHERVYIANAGRHI